MLKLVITRLLLVSYKWAMLNCFGTRDLEDTLKRLCLSVFAIGLFSNSAYAADSLLRDVRKIRDQSYSESPAYEIVESLTMEVGPRSAGSAGDIAAVQWAVARFKSLGFSNVHTEPVVVPHWDRGRTDVRIVSPFPQTLVATALGGSPGTPEQGISAGVVRVDSLASLSAASPSSIAGKIVFIDQIMERHQDGSGYGKVNRNRTCGHWQANLLGAAAVVTRSSGTSKARVPHTGAMMSMPAKIPAFALSNADADILAYQIKQGNEVAMRLYSSARYLPDVMSANVVGEIPGGDAADEIVLLAAHLDSWDLGTGAIDDGAGVAIVIAAAKMIMESKPRRTIRVVLFANEEAGLSGATQYALDHANEVEKHIIAMEADFGAGRVWRLSSQVAEAALPRIDELHRVLKSLGLQRGDNKAGGGADIGPMRALGMPVLGLTQDGSDYFDYHHTPDDTLDKIDVNDLNQNVAVYATAAYYAANVEGNFGRLTPKPTDYRCDNLTPP